jgi:3-dehydroquinate dehydratase
VESLFRFTARYCGDIQLVTISMGRIGTISRVMNPLVGSCLTYGYVSSGTGVAPGMIPARELKNLLEKFSENKLDIADAEEVMTGAIQDGLLTVSPEAVSA